MVVSADTSFLRSLYGRDVHTPSAVATAEQLSVPITISAFGVFEFENAVRLAEWRKVIPTEVAAEQIARLHAALSAGRLKQQACSDHELAARARALTAAHTARLGNRGFDTLLLAVAQLFRADVFLTFDARQRALAAAEGLRTEI